MTILDLLEKDRNKPGRISVYIKAIKDNRRSHKKGSDVLVKRAILISILVIFLAASAAIYAGCGGSTSSAIPDAQKVFDDAMREAVRGNFQPFINMMLPDLRDAYAQGIEQTFPYTNANIVELNYRTDTTDADHVTVYFWGVFDMPGGDQKTITEDQAEGIPLVQQDGQWYFDYAPATSQQQTPSQ